MSSNTAASRSKSSTPNASTLKNAPSKSVRIKLKIPEELLKKYRRDRPSPAVKSSGASSPMALPDISTPAAEPSQDPKQQAQQQQVDGEKKPMPIKLGVKTAPTTAPKPRARPGPKRRKIETDDSQPWTVTMTGPGAHKLGPKANQGMINANLRALDRKNLNPCRKWGKKTFTLRTFNGSEWSVNAWSAPPKVVTKPDGIENTTPSSNSDHAQPSSNVPSVGSRQPEEKKNAALITAAPIAGEGAASTQDSISNPIA